MREALAQRFSCRAFLPDAVPEADVRAILTDASQSPSGGNVQPWRVWALAGEARDALVARVKAAIEADPFADEGPFPAYPPKLWEPYRERRTVLGEAMYATLGIPREDKLARLAWLARNYEFFGAPVGLIFALDKGFNANQWAHLGMFMQSLALAATARGYATCMQESWMARAKTVAAALNVPGDLQVYCGMALGRADAQAPVNGFRSERAPADAFATLAGFA